MKPPVPMVLADRRSALQAQGGAIVMLLTIAIGLSPALSQTTLPLSAQEDLLRTELTASIESGDYRNQVALVERYRMLNVPFPTPLYYVEAVAAFRTGNIARAYWSAQEFLSRSKSGTPEYENGLNLYRSIRSQANQSSGGYLDVLEALSRYHRRPGGTWYHVNDSPQECSDADKSYVNLRGYIYAQSPRHSLPEGVGTLYFDVYATRPKAEANRLKPSDRPELGGMCVYNIIAGEVVKTEYGLAARAVPQGPDFWCWSEVYFVPSDSDGIRIIASASKDSSARSADHCPGASDFNYSATFQPY